MLGVQSRKKIMRQSKEIKLNLKGPRNLESSFCEIFGCYGQSLIFGRETGHWAQYPTNFEIFLMFLSFLRSLVLSRSATHEVTRV